MLPVLPFSQQSGNEAGFKHSALYLIKALYGFPRNIYPIHTDKGLYKISGFLEAVGSGSETHLQDRSVKIIQDYILHEALLGLLGSYHFVIPNTSFNSNK